jgi:hypothetical protein
MEKFIVDINPQTDKVEDFEREDKNLLKVRVQLPNGDMIEGQDYRVEITLSKEAMLGLGTSLIRAAHSGKDLKFWHLHPADSSLTSQNFGVFLHPESCELLIAEKDFENIHKIVGMLDNNKL